MAGAGPTKVRQRQPKALPRKGAETRSVFVAVSLDGFIAREDGDLDWLEGHGGAKGEDYGYAAFMARIDAVVMGRRTFEKVLTFGEWPYGEKPVIVLTRGPSPVPRELEARAEAMAGSPRRIVERLANRGLRRLYIDGGQTIREFLKAGLIDELTTTRIPVLLGRGVPLFGPVEADIQFRHAGTRQFPNGFVQSRYRVSKRVPAGSGVAETPRSR